MMKQFFTSQHLKDSPSARTLLSNQAQFNHFSHIFSICPVNNSSLHLSAIGSIKRSGIELSFGLQDFIEGSLMLVQLGKKIPHPEPIRLAARRLHVHKRDASRMTILSFQCCPPCNL